MKRQITLAALLLSISSTLFAANGTIVRSTSLYATPSFTAKKASKLSIGFEVKSLQRKGGWRKVSVKNISKTGWIRSYAMRIGVTSKQVKSATSKNKRSSGGLASLSRSITGLFGGNQSAQTTGGTTATIGIRGLNAETISTAQPDNAAISKMETYGVSSQSAESFAASAKLSPNTMYHVVPQYNAYSYEE